MKKILRIIFVLIIILFLYFTVGGIFLLNRTRTASESLLNSLMLIGADNTRSYMPKITMFPPGASVNNLEISAKEGYIDGFKWVDINAKSNRIKMDASDVISGKFPQIHQIENLTLTGKIPFDVLSLMLEKKNEGWENIKIGRLGDEGSTIYVYAKKTDADTSMNLIGSFLVNKEGNLLFYPSDDKYFDSDGNLNLEVYKEARKGMDIMWQFSFFGIFIPLNRVAVSEAGIYVEAGDAFPANQLINN